MIWRLIFTVQIANSLDWTYDLYTTALMSCLEVWLGIIAASLPTLAPLGSQFISPMYKRYLSSYFSKFSSAGSSGRHTGLSKYQARPFRAMESSKKEHFRLDDSIEEPVELLETRRLNPVDSKPGGRSTGHASVRVAHDIDVQIENPLV